MFFEEEEYGADESLVVSTKTEYDAEENVLRPKVMSDYVGQQKVKENLSARVFRVSARQFANRNFSECNFHFLNFSTLNKDTSIKLYVDFLTYPIICGRRRI